MRRVRSLFILGVPREPGVQVSGLYRRSNHRAQSQSDTRGARWKYQRFAEIIGEGGLDPVVGEALENFTVGCLVVTQFSGSSDVLMRAFQ